MVKLKDDRRRIKKAKKQRDVAQLYNEAIGHIDHLEEELKAAKRIMVPSRPFEIRPAEGKGTSEATAVVLLSDWHVEEVVTAAQTNGLNIYNPAVAKHRSVECFQRIVKMVRKEQQDVKIGTLIVWLGGDFITNSLRDENLENNAMPPVEAARYAKTLLSSGLTFLQNQLEGMKIVCVCSSGNHGRITQKVHISTEYGNSLETFIYTSLRDELPGITWVIEPSYLTYVDVYGYTLRFQHGHFVLYQGGIGGLTIPFLKALNGWDNQKKATLTLAGHFHQYFMHRRFVVNGSLIGFNSYAIALKCEYEPPCQAFFLIDKARGRTVNIPILFSR